MFFDLESLASVSSTCSVEKLNRGSLVFESMEIHVR